MGQCRQAQPWPPQSRESSWGTKQESATGKYLWHFRCGKHPRQVWRSTVGERGLEGTGEEQTGARREQCGECAGLREQEQCVEEPRGGIKLRVSCFTSPFCPQVLWAPPSSYTQKHHFSTPPWTVGGKEKGSPRLGQGPGQAGILSPGKEFGCNRNAARSHTCVGFKQGSEGV